MRWMLLLALCLIGCTKFDSTKHKFEANDCVVQEDNDPRREDWEVVPEPNIYKILKVGKYKYLLISVNQKQYVEKFDIVFRTIDNSFKWTSCP